MSGINSCHYSELDLGLNMCNWQCWSRGMAAAMSGAGKFLWFRAELWSLGVLAAVAVNQHAWRIG